MVGAGGKFSYFCFLDWLKMALQENISLPPYIIHTNIFAALDDNSPLFLKIFKISPLILKPIFQVPPYFKGGAETMLYPNGCLS